nr:hypothetical protein [Tanacetum cinerariifolium]
MLWSVVDAREFTDLSVPRPPGNQIHISSHSLCNNIIGNTLQGRWIVPCFVCITSTDVNNRPQCPGPQSAKNKGYFCGQLVWF